ncbi:MAG: hypothetical protein U0401_08975 [Anaerolineae bacterium]
MFTELNSFISTETIIADVNNYVDDRLIEEIWRDLGKQITHEQIRQAALEVADEFRDATIITFIPIFIRRLTFEKLSNSQ